MNKDDIKNAILSENTAQGVLNHLRDHESNRARMQKRWVWELLQNARDAASDQDTQLDASVIVRNDELVFEHNGQGFTSIEVGHLIFHGSSKIEDENTLGRYGSGFLTTHLLSPRVDVAGQLQDGTDFSFLLNRQITSAQTLSESMDRAWDSFHASLRSAESMPSSFSTRFRYPLTDDSSDAIHEGIDTLRRCAPYVVAFNRQFRSVNIRFHDKSTSFEVIERIPVEQDRLYKVTVRVNDLEHPKDVQFLLAHGERASVAVSLENSNAGMKCIPTESIPRLFLGFPLVGTESFSFPAVINSFAFTPTENRDGVYLGQSDDSPNRTNQGVIEEASILYAELLRFVAKSKWTDIYALATIPPITSQSWLNVNWLKRQLNKLVRRIRQTPSVLCQGHAIAPEHAALPLAERPANVESIWNLLNELKTFRQNLPDRNQAPGWNEAIESWADVTDRQSTTFAEAVGGAKMVSHLEKMAKEPGGSKCTLNELQRLLFDGTGAVEWLDLLLAFLKNDGLDDLIRERPLILNQSGCLDRLSNLYHDVGIDEELKYISDRVLDLKIQSTLRDNRLTTVSDEQGKGSYSNDDVTRKIIDLITNKFTNDTISQSSAQASARLLACLAVKQRWNYLMNFPAFSTGRIDGSRHALWLGQQGTDDSDLPLAPARAWPEELRQFEDVFPPSYIVSDEFFESMPDVRVWQTLAERGFVRSDVIIRTQRTIGDFLPDEPLPECFHRSVDLITVSDLAFLAKDRVGVMARVRDSQDRARLFWRFLTQWLSVADCTGLTPTNTECVCGDSHAYLSAVWLVPLVRNRWVPQGNDIRDNATAQSLARLLRGSGWTPTSSIAEDSPTSKLLEALQVTRLDLMREFLVTDDKSRAILDNAMTSILASTAGDLSHVNDFVEDMKTDKDLPDYLAERRKRRRTILANHLLGNQVEELVKQSLESEGFTVKRTGIGSDFEIEHDLIEGDKEIGIELTRSQRSWLVEVKATRDQSVRMTAKQAETAVKRGSSFLLCVVPVAQNGDEVAGHDVRGSLRFVQNIGPRIEPLCEDLNALDDLRDVANSSNEGDIRLEILAGSARIRVDNSVWDSGVPLEKLSEALI